jgi:hypothetical protein
MNPPIILADPQERARERDRDFSWGEYLITGVEGDDGESATITVDGLRAGRGFGGWTTLMPWPGDPRPEVGMLLRVWSNGSRNHGVDLLGTESERLDSPIHLYYKTEREMEVEQAAWIADDQRRQRKAFEENKAKLDADFDALHPAMKRRIQRFRDEDPDFRWRAEGYEMVVCSEATRLHKAAMDPATGALLKANGIKLPSDRSLPIYDRRELEGVTDWEDTPENRLAAINAINGAPNGYQYKLLEKLFPWIDPGHSGMTWSAAVQMAGILIRDGENARL